MTTTINIHVDDRDAELKVADGKPFVVAQNKLGTLSSIDISSFDAAVQYGFGSNNYAKRDRKKYVSSDLKQAKNDLINIENCNVLATVGGTVVHKAIVGDSNNVPFVSVLGDTLDLSNLPSLGACKGGISLNSWRSNKARVSYLIKKFATIDPSFTVSNIGLYYNSNSAMSPDEISDWNNNPAIGLAKPMTGATRDALGNPQNADTFAQDLNNTSGFFPDTVKAIVISADPFFQDNKNSLIYALNTWLVQDATRKYIMYPLQDYRNTGGTSQPTGGKATLYGPDLKMVFRVLGFLAKNAIENHDGIAFFTASDVISDL